MNTQNRRILFPSISRTMNESYQQDFSVTNLTLEQCQSQYRNQTYLLSKLHSGEFCDVTFDSILCWPPTSINETAVIKCFSELFSIKYDETQNATRNCLWNKTWSKANYSMCREIVVLPTDAETQTTIYFVGYTLSLVTLSIAMLIFTYFKELRCLRNTIHMNLMISYMLTYSMWILTLILLNAGTHTTMTCAFIVTLLHYFNITTFFWMFVEGLYLYILVVETLTRENLKLRVYQFIGWGLPLIFISLWAIVKSILPGEDSDLNMCPWFEPHTVDWIYQTPTLVVLLLNLGFLICIMWVLITKLRSTNSLEKQQYHKAAKALLVLMPLLGITHVITIYGPVGDKTTSNIFECTRAVLLSTQGFSIAILYCFLNTEVQNAITHHFEMWKTKRSLGTKSFRSSGRSKDWSPRSRTESIRLYQHPTKIYRKRESCSSEMTTTTLITLNGGIVKPLHGTPTPRTSFLHPPRTSLGGSL